MTLEELRVKLDDAKDNTEIVQVVFDYLTYLNYGEKSYPLIIWDFNNMSGTIDLSGGEKILTINAWCIDETLPDSDVENRHKVWDDIEMNFIEYLQAVASASEITIQNIRAMEFEYYPAGLLSMEREMGVRYQVEMKLWC